MFGIGLFAVGAALHFWSMRILTSANRDAPLPMIFGWIRNTPRRPAAFYVLLIVSLALLLWGAVWATQSMGDWAALAVVVMAPSLILSVKHNRAVASRSPAEHEETRT